MNRKTLCTQFAEQKTTSGRASNLYYDGAVMYSYGAHFPVAVLDTKTKTAFVNSDNYSVSTSRQVGAARFALSSAGYTLVHYDTAEMLIAVNSLK